MPAKSPTRRPAAVALAALTALSGCWTVPPDDAGDAQFVQFAVLTTLGRQPYSQDEVDVLVDLVQEDGRTALVDVLMEQPEFVTYWTRQLMDVMDVAVEGDQKVDDTTCYEDKRLATHLYDDLVYHLRYQSWKTPFCPSTGPWIAPRSTLPPAPTPIQTHFTAGDAQQMRDQFDSFAGPAPYTRGVVAPRLDDKEFTGDGHAPGVPMPGSTVTAKATNCESFTMADAYAAALQEDAIDALYRVGMVPLATTSQDTGEALARFLEVYVDRDPSCVECHGTNVSPTNGRPGNDDWDRFHPATMVDLEMSAFSYTSGGNFYDGSLGGAEVGLRVRNLFRGDGWRVSNGLYPFGIDGACAHDGPRNGFNTSVPTNASLPGAFSGMEGTNKGIGDLVDHFAVGVAAHGWDQITPGPNPIFGNAATGLANVGLCTGCHPGGDAPDLYEVTRYMSAARIYDTIKNGSPAGLMPALAIDDQLAKDIAVHLADSPGHVDPQIYSTRASTFAHLTAMAFVNDVYEVVAGESLVLAHYTPRNEDAAATLEYLTRVFVDADWSFKALMREIVDSQFANRRAPSESAEGPYELPMVFTPWADIGPGTTQLGEDANGQGDIVHRYPVPSLLHRIEHALGWEAPMFPSTNAATYADVPFQRAFGARTGPVFRGVDEVGTAPLLAWEREMGACLNPSLDPDYISVLAGKEELTVEQAMLAVKGRLLGVWAFYDDPWANGGVVGPGGPQDERTLAAALATRRGVGLADTVDAVGAEDAIRDYCGAVLMSPDFLLGGLPGWDDTAGTMDPGLPCVDAECSYSDYCDRYAADAGVLGYGFDCEIGGFTTGS